MIRKLAPLLVTLGLAAPASVALADEGHGRYIIPNDTNVVQVRNERWGHDHDRFEGRDNRFSQRRWDHGYRPAPVQTYRPAPVRVYPRWSRFAPPAVRVEMVRPRPGYLWVNGNYAWRNDQYVWSPGRYEAQQANRVWVPGRWAVQDGYYVWVDGYWQDQPQQVWIEGRTEWRNGYSVWIPGHWQQTAIYR